MNNFCFKLLSNFLGALQKIGCGEIENILKENSRIYSVFSQKNALSPAKFQKAAGKVGIELGKPP